VTVDKSRDDFGIPKPTKINGEIIIRKSLTLENIISSLKSLKGIRAVSS
jgi:hypothetical protein